MTARAHPGQAVQHLGVQAAQKEEESRQIDRCLHSFQPAWLTSSQVNVHHGLESKDMSRCHNQERIVMPCWKRVQHYSQRLQVRALEDQAPLIRTVLAAVGAGGS